jgi:hypothetical protein
VVVVATDALLSTDSVEADETEPQPDDVIGGPRLDMVVHSFSISKHGCTSRMT